MAAVTLDYSQPGLPRVRGRNRRRIYLNRREKWMYRLSALVTLVTVIGAWVLVIGFIGLLLDSREAFDFDTAIEQIGYFTTAAMLPISLIIVKIMRYRQATISGVELGPQQYPRIYNLAQQYAYMAGLDYTPRIVLTTQSPPLDDTVGWGTTSVMIHYDLFEICRNNGDPSALRFALARQIGRIAGGQYGKRRQILKSVSDTLPIWNGLLQRAECYTADMWGLLLAPDAAADYLGMVGASKVRWPELNPYQLANQATLDGRSQTLTVASGGLPPISWRAWTMAQTGVFQQYPPGTTVPAMQGLDPDGVRLPVPVQVPIPTPVALERAVGHLIWPPRKPIPAHINVPKAAPDTHNR